MLKWLTHLDKQEIEEVSKLHHHLLPHSPIPQLGKGFMNNFYYKDLVRQNIIKCLVYIEKETVVGFVVTTKYPQNFMSKGIIRSPIKLASTLIISILKKPVRLLIVLKIILLALARGSSNIPGKTTEIISIGVKKEFRNHVISNSSLKISSLIFLEILNSLKSRNEKFLQAITEKNNKRAIKFYKKMGMVLTESELSSHKDIVFRLTL